MRKLIENVLLKSIDLGEIRKKSSNKILKIVIFTLLSISAASKINAQFVNIPDAKFKSYLLSIVKHPTSINNITPAEAASFKGKFDLYRIKSFNLTGINAFTGLTGINCSNDTITNFDVSGCKSLKYLDCSYCKFGSININGCNLLDSITIMYTDSISSIDLSSDTSLRYLDLTYNFKLKSINIKNGHIDSLKKLLVAFCYKVNCIQVDDTAKAIAKPYYDWSVTYNSLYSTNCFGTSLPIKFLNVFASNTNNGNKINWSVLNNENASYYTIQQSNNGNDFSNIANIASSNLPSYNYLVQNTTFKKVYYRIVATEKDGTKSFSEIISLNNSQKSLINVYPNPVKDYVYIDGNNVQQISIKNLAGKVFVQQTNLNTTHSKLDIAFLPQGIYFVEIITANGKEVGKIIK